MKNTTISRITRNLFVTAILLSTLCFNTNSQGLVEKFGGIKTNFVICDSKGEIDVLDQAIIKRTYQGTSSSEKAAYGYASQALFLEFSSLQKSKALKNINKTIFLSSFTVSLSDKDGNNIFSEEFSLSSFQSNTRNTSLYSYSLNLMHIPLIVLEKTHKITIQ